VTRPNQSDPGVGSTARVTVIVPCYNDGRLALEAIASIDEAEPVDVILVDDGSTVPETVEILDGFAEARTTILRHEANQGLANTRNTGLRGAKTPYVFPLDSDDLAFPGALAKMADRLDAAPDAAVCFGDYLEFGDHEIVRAVPDWLDPFRLAYVNEYPVSSLLRRDVLDAIGGWRKAAPAYEDWDLWLTLAERGYRGVHLGHGELTFRKRFHGERMLAVAKRTHHSLYRRIQQDHAGLYSDIGRHRRESDLPFHRKVLYPVVYGSRHRFTFERHVKHWLDRRGIWTLRR
jgi:glycosyltransferase involved in cell wall biosynthesis